MFSKGCEYGIRAVLYIAEQSKKSLRPNLTEIAEAIDSPVAFTAKILQKLARNGVVESRKGPTGGFVVYPENKLKLIDVVVATDGDAVFSGCGLGLPECSEAHPCPIHDQFVAVRGGLKQMLEKTEIDGLAEKLVAGGTFLKL